jgi:hypothetical protein
MAGITATAGRTSGSGKMHLVLLLLLLPRGRLMTVQGAGALRLAAAEQLQQYLATMLSRLLLLLLALPVPLVPMLLHPECSPWLGKLPCHRLLACLCPGSRSHNVSCVEQCCSCWRQLPRSLLLCSSLNVALQKLQGRDQMQQLQAAVAAAS